MNNLVCGRGINRIIDFGLKIKPSVESKTLSQMGFYFGHIYVLCFTPFFHHVQYLRHQWLYFGKTWTHDASHHSGVAFLKLYKLPKGDAIIIAKNKLTYLFIAKDLEYRFQRRALVSHCVNAILRDFTTAQSNQFCGKCLYLQKIM